MNPSQPERNATVRGSVNTQRKNSARRGENAATSASRQPMVRATPRSERERAGGGPRRPGVLEGGDGPLRNAHLVDLVRPVGEAGPAGVLEHVGQRRVSRVAEGTVKL